MSPPDHSQFEFHKLSFFVVLLFTGKSGLYNLNFKDYGIKKGTLFTLRKDNIHKFYKNRATGHLLVFTEDFILNNSSDVEASKTFSLFNEMLASPKIQLNKKDYDAVIMLIDLIKQEYLSNKDDYSLSIIRSYLQVIITKLFRIKSKGNVVFDKRKYISMFLQLQSLIEKECFKHKKVAYYAKQMAVSAKTLNNVTQSILDRSAKTLINEIVIMRTKQLIINSSDSLSEIGYQVGFEDPTNFFKYFRRYTGVSPRHFKAKYQSI